MNVLVIESFKVANESLKVQTKLKRDEIHGWFGSVLPRQNRPSGNFNVNFRRFIERYGEQCTANVTNIPRIVTRPSLLPPIANESHWSVNNLNSTHVAGHRYECQSRFRGTPFMCGDVEARVSRLAVYPQFPPVTNWQRGFSSRQDTRTEFDLAMPGTLVRNPCVFEDPNSIWIDIVGLYNSSIVTEMEMVSKWKLNKWYYKKRATG